MQELAALPLLAQPSQPMLAYEVVEVGIAVRRGVFIWTSRAQRTVAL
jgi:hypothetical protein